MGENKDRQNELSEGDIISSIVSCEEEGNRGNVSSNSNLW